MKIVVFGGVTALKKEAVHFPRRLQIPGKLIGGYLHWFTFEKTLE